MNERKGGRKKPGSDHAGGNYDDVFASPFRVGAALDDSGFHIPGFAFPVDGDSPAPAFDTGAAPCDFPAYGSWVWKTAFRQSSGVVLGLLPLARKPRRPQLRRCARRGQLLLPLCHPPAPLLHGASVHTDPLLREQ